MFRRLDVEQNGCGNRKTLHIAGCRIQCHRFGYWMTKAQTLFLPGFIGVCITATILILLGRNDKAACLELAKNFSRN